MTLDELVRERDCGRAFISLAKSPGNFGRRVYAAAFAHLGLPYTYTPLVCTDIDHDIDLIRQHAIPGASITMPHKTRVLDLVDEADETARQVGAANTIVNRDGKLIAYNTDFCGVQAALMSVVETDHMAIIGKGAMARTFDAARVCTTEMIGRDQLGWTNHQATVVVNATPMGMPGVASYDGLLDMFPHCDFYIECVVNPTPTEELARARGIAVFTGLDIAFQQAFAQFELYTGLEPPIDVMRAAIS